MRFESLMVDDVPAWVLLSGSTCVELLLLRKRIVSPALLSGAFFIFKGMVKG